MLAGNEVKAEYVDACYNPVSISFFKQLWVKKLNLMFQYVAMWWCLGVWCWPLTYVEAQLKKRFYHSK